MGFKEIAATDFVASPFRTIGREWLLVAADDGKQANAMTASWGGFGVMWGKDVAFIVIRPQRYTKEFIDKADGFSLSVFAESYRSMLNYFGSVSGRTEDKITKAGLTAVHSDGRIYFQEAKVTMLCRKLYAQKMQPDCFLDEACREKWYPDKDYHTLYIAEIDKILIQDD